MYMYWQKLLCITSDEMNGIVESCSQTTIKCDGSLGMRLGIVGVSESELHTTGSLQEGHLWRILALVSNYAHIMHDK